MEDDPDRSPSFPQPIHHLLLAWAEAHSKLLQAEADLVSLCRRLAEPEVTAEDVASQRAHVAALCELAEDLYATAMRSLAS